MSEPVSPEPASPGWRGRVAFWLAALLLLAGLDHLIREIGARRRILRSARQFRHEARQALSSGELQKAQQLFEKAQDTAGRVLGRESTEAVAILEEQADMHLENGGARKAAGLYQQVVTARLTTSGNTVQLSGPLTSMGQALLLIGDLKGSQRALKEAIASIRASAVASTEKQRRPHLLLTRAQELSGALHEAQASAQAAVDCTPEGPAWEPLLATIAYPTLARIEWERGNRAAAAAIFAGCTRLMEPRAKEVPVDYATTLGHEVDFLIETGDFSRARERLDRLTQLASRQNIGDQAATLRVLSIIASAHPEMERGLEPPGRAFGWLEMWVRSHRDWLVDNARQRRSLAASLATLALGDRARRWLQREVTILSTASLYRDYPLGHALALQALATYLMKRGFLDEAILRLDEALDLLKSKGHALTEASLRSDCAEALRARGNAKLAARELAAALPLMEAMHGKNSSQAAELRARITAIQMEIKQISGKR